MKNSYDCIVIGGGPAGCATASLVAAAGYSTLLVEREQVPRFHIGESLMAEAYWPLQRIGVWEKLPAANFVRKLSMQFVGPSGKETQPFYFPEHDPHESSCSWQVDRSEFDRLLYENAREKGADCYDRTVVEEVFFDGDRAQGVRLSPPGGSSVEIRCRVVVDATGLQAFLANRLGLKVEDPQLRKAAIWGYYRRALRDAGEHAGATVVLPTCDQKSWFWFIPLANDLTSIGVVGDHSYLLKGRGKPAQVFEDELVRCPGLVTRLMHAELVSDFRVAKEFCYRTTQHAGDGWVLVGDAFGFIDPIFSSGVFLALRSGELAAAAIVDGLRTNDTSGAQLGKWSPEFERGVHWIRRLVKAFYANPFVFGQFLRAHPEHKRNLVDIMMGRVFQEGAGGMFDDLDRMLSKLPPSAERSGLASAHQRLP